MNSRCLNEIKAEALRLGFFACGVAKASKVADSDIEAYLSTMQNGGFGCMDYLCNNLDKRFDPTLLMPGAKSIISVALNYNPQHHIPSGNYQIATYAYGRDYHDVMRRMLHQLATQIGLTDYRAFCDTAPVLERYWAAQAGIGWIGKNHQLIVPGAGSRVFLGEIITTDELPISEEHLTPHCGQCTQCIDACPTGATFGSQAWIPQCLSYLTIENRGDIPAEAAAKMSPCFYGCDRCTDACPWSRNVESTQIADFHPSEELLQMTNEDWQNLSEEDYQRLFKGSAVKRAKYEGLKRNIKAMQ